MKIDPLQLLDWLSECDGDSIWGRDYCQQRGIPDYLIDALEDAHESGFAEANNSITYQHQRVNQFEGVKDVDLAIWIGKQLNVNVSRILSMHASRSAIVKAIKEEYEEG